jgi:hypothetical protein
MNDEPRLRTRVRISHSRTIKGGWGFESTVETDWDGTTPDPEALLRIEHLLRDVDLIGRAESLRRNDVEDHGG